MNEPKEKEEDQKPIDLDDFNIKRNAELGTERLHAFGIDPETVRVVNRYRRE